MEDENKENKEDIVENVPQDAASAEVSKEPEQAGQNPVVTKPESGAVQGDEPGAADQVDEEEDELTGIEEATEQEIVQKVTKKETRKKRRKRGEKGQDKKESSEWIEKVVQIRRVTKVVKGGKKLSFRAVVIVGNAKGQVGVGVGKASEVIGAIQKGVVDAKKSIVNVPLLEATIPHQILGRAGAAKVLLKPAREGTGIKAGGAARTVLELGGVGDILSKSLGSRSPLNVARATLNGLCRLRKFNDVAKLRGVTLKEMIG